MKKYIQYIVLLAAWVALCSSVALDQATAQPSQQWLITYDGPTHYYDHISDLLVDVYGYVYMTGYSERVNTSYDFTTLKYDPWGELQWEAEFNGSANQSDTPSALDVDSDGNVYVTGTSADTSAQNVITTIKYDADGNEQWVAFYHGLYGEGNHGADIKVDEYGNVYITGSSSEFYKGTNFITIKYDNDGNELWVAHFFGGGWEIAKALDVDEAGNVYVTGGSYVSGESNNYLTIKYDTDGNELWTASFDGTDHDTDSPADLILDADGNVVITGTCSMTYGYSDFGTVKYDSDGNQLWSVFYNGPAGESDWANDMAVDAEGNIYVAGSTETIWYNQDFATVKYDVDGNEQWVAMYNGPANYSDGADALALDADGNVYVTGNSDGISSDYDIATIKYNSEGVEQWVMRFDGPDHQDDHAIDIEVDQSGNVYVGGESRSFETDDDLVAIKYNQQADLYFGITLIPFQSPIQIPGSGGSFEYNLFAENNLGETHTADIWITVIPPPYSAHLTVLGPITLDLTSGTTGWYRVQTVPEGAPAGQYQYLTKIGLYPYLVWACDTLTVEKLEGGDDNASDGWDNWGDSFGDEGTKPGQITNYNMVTNYPNPFNPTTTISFQLQEARYSTLTVFDVQGREVAKLVDGYRQAGLHEVTFDASSLASGIYIYCLDAGDFSATGKMVLMK